MAWKGVFSMPLFFPPAPTAYFQRKPEQKKGSVPVEPIYNMIQPAPIQQQVQQNQVPPHRLPPLARMLKNPQSLPPGMGAQMPPRQSAAPPPMIPPMIPQHTSPMIPQQTATLPPEKAAEKFQHMNKNLPDGVHYEPLDDETMQLLRKHRPSTPQQSAPPVQP
jgi:hypothetical protein